MIDPAFVGAGLFVAGVVIGALAGAFVVRNNYKRLRAYEQEFKDLVLDAKVSNDQLVARIRNRLKV
jgi:hypothetical protein